LAQSAPRLLWSRERIAHLEATGKTRAAIELARQANLICAGAAFIAWDETEKVAIAAPGRELYQPAFEVAGAPAPGRERMSLDKMVFDVGVCLASPAPSPRRVRQSWWSRLAEAAHGPSEPLASAPFQEEQVGPVVRIDPEALPRPFEAMLQEAMARCARLGVSLTAIPRLIAALLEVWREDFKRLVSAPRYRRLVENLGHWVEDSPNDAQDRLLCLQKLLGDLAAQPKSPEAVLRRWCEENVIEPSVLRERVLREVDCLERLAASRPAASR
jgi:hypothetical protein